LEFLYYNTTNIIQKYLNKKLQNYNMKKTIVTSIRLDEEIWKEAKRHALELDLKVGKFVESAIIHEIQRIKR